MAFVGGDLYLAEASGLSVIRNAASCRSGCSATPVAGVAQVETAGIATDGVDNIWLIQAPNVMRVTISTGEVSVFASQGTLPGGYTPLTSMFSEGNSGCVDSVCAFTFAAGQPNLLALGADGSVIVARIRACSRRWIRARSAAGCGGSDMISGGARPECRGRKQPAWGAAAPYPARMSIPQAFLVHALPADILARVRSTGVDVSGNPVQPARAEGGEPLRCCLRNARPGEALILFGYEPPIGDSPYREIGAVFAHACPCEGPETAGAYPAGWRGRRQVLRSYDRRGWIRDATVHDGSDPEAEIARLFADPEAVQLHSRNVAYGCFMFVVTRNG